MNTKKIYDVYRGFAVLSQAIGKYKEAVGSVVASVLFVSGTLKWLNYAANRVRCKRSADGTVEFPFLRRRRSGNLQILIYHRVNDENDPFFTGVPVSLFKAQMEYLASNFCVLPLEEAVERLKRRDVPDNAVVITFDDGYRDNYINAFPLLRSLALPATIFLAVDAIGSRHVLWHDKVFAAFRETRIGVLKGFADGSSVYPLTTLAEKVLAQEKALTFIRSLDEEARAFAVNRLIDKLEVSELRSQPDLMLSWHEVTAMQNGGISFGSHSVTHPILAKVSLERARDEIVRAKQIIEERLGTCVRTFAYPNGRTGDFNQTTKMLLQDSGHVCALTTNFGTNECDQDLFELRRATPWGHDIETFGLRLNYYRLCS